MSKHSALLVIDVQVGMFEEAQPVHRGDGLLQNIQLLIAKARAHDVPIIYVQHNEEVGDSLEPNTPGWQIHPAIAPTDGDIIIQKRTPDSFHQTDLQDELEKAGVSRLVLTGMQTELCVDTTCRRAFSLGYDVVLVKDAHSTFDSAYLSASDIVSHHNGLLRWFAETEESANITF